MLRGRWNPAVGVALIASSALIVGAGATTSWGQETGSSPASGSRTVWAGAFTEDQARRGSAVYAQECANCHGGALEGADMSPPLTGAAFMANWNELTVADLFERIRISMPADRPGTLSRQQNADVIAYLLQVNGFPKGASELPTATPALKGLTIVSVKPGDAVR